MAKPTKLDVPYVPIHCRRLMAALLSVGVDFAKGVPPACLVVSDSGERLDPPEEFYHVELKARNRITQTKSLIESWDDVGRMKEDGEVDAVSFLNRVIKDLRVAMAKTPEALKLLNQLEAILPCVAVTYMRTFAINYGNLTKTQGKIVSYDRTYHQMDRRVKRKRQLETQKAKIEAELADLNRKLANKPPKFNFPRLRLHRDNQTNERTA